MGSNSEKAVDMFHHGFSCSQAVLGSHSADYGLDAEAAKKIAGSFIGGMANNGEVCGAVVGALMLIGLKYGQYIEGDTDSKEKNIKMANKYIESFRKEHGSIICKDLLKYNISIDEEARKARESGVFKTLCPIFVKRSVELAEEVLEMA
jgi:C_GCAxxG_C_C family probable redox protein